MLYPEIEPFEHGYYQTPDGHEVYWEMVGNPQGKPAIFLHGGPGGGCHPSYRRLFNPEKYCVLLFDQRGCGRSKPFACLENNTTWDLVKDIEHFREHMLKTDKMLVFGGSWGSTLSLTYAETYPEHVTELVLRGIYLTRQSEQDWIYQGGAANIFPDAWEDFIAPIPPEERDNFMVAYHKRLTGSDEAEKLRCAQAWTHWEDCIIRLYPAENNEHNDPSFALPFARIENHYFIHHCWLRDNQLLDDIHRIQDIPGIIVQGRYDICTPPTSAWALHKAWPKARFQWVPDSGHAMAEPGTLKALISYLDELVGVTGRDTSPTQ